jgi:hypothetical protein
MQQLLVEGKDDQHVIWALCEKFTFKENFKVIDCTGFENLMIQIPIRLKQSNIKTLGIIVDADLEIENRWQSIYTKFKNIYSDFPSSIPTDGLIFQTEEIKIGIWIMPNNKTSGMIEDFITFLIPSEDKLLPKITAFLNDLEKESLNKYSLNHTSKAKLNVWLALQETPVPMGLSITKKYLTTEEANCQLFIGWLKNLFS